MDEFQIVMKSSLSQCTSLVKFSWKYDQQFSSGQVGHCWCLVWGYALHGWFPNYYENFLGSRSISDKKCHEDTISSYSNIRRVIIPLSTGGGLHSTNGFQSVKETSLWQDRFLIKFSWRYDLVRCTIAGAVWRYALYGWVIKCNGEFLGHWYISGRIFMKMWSVG